MFSNILDVSGEKRRRKRVLYDFFEYILIGFRIWIYYYVKVVVFIISLGLFSEFYMVWMDEGGIVIK